ncbi:probable low affinity copper uptake protein 2 isoform X2 [Papio anubis]|nr:probable low affinity copper uptake protein 2 isoform X2 [Papio anubis]
MHFIFSDTVVLLFDFWSVHSPAGMALSVLVLLLLAVLYEGIKVGKAKLLHQVLVNLPTSISQQTIAETDGDSAGSDSSPVGRTHHRPDDPTTPQPPTYLSAFAQDVLPPLLPYLLGSAQMSAQMSPPLGNLPSSPGYFLFWAPQHLTPIFVSLSPFLDCEIREGQVPCMHFL